MKYYRFIFVLLLLTFFLGCQSEPAETEGTEISRDQSDEQQITAMLIEMIDRVKEGDKTVLWEMEYQYLTDSITLDEYMETPRVLNYKYDSLSGINVDSVFLLGDSAIAITTVLYKSYSGEKKEKQYPLKVFRYKGRWIKPYLSVLRRDVEYQALLKSYYESIEDEEDE